MQNFPSDYRYTKDHEWLDVKGKNSALVGVTSYAVEQLGDIVHMELPDLGEEFEAGASFGTIESTKTVSDLYMPVTGKVVAVNDEILGSLETLQENPHDKGWLVKIEVKSEGDLKKLMDAKAYEAYLKDSNG